MSYNIDSIEIIEQDAFDFEYEGLADAIGDNDVPETFGLHKLRGYIQRNSFPWTGEGSGRSEDFLMDLLGRFTGSADMVLTWEGGDSHSGIRVTNGVVTKHKVVFKLGDTIDE